MHGKNYVFKIHIVMHQVKRTCLNDKFNETHELSCYLPQDYNLKMS